MPSKPDLETDSWIEQTRPAPAFRVDLWFSVPAYVPPWLRPAGERDTAREIAEMPLAMPGGVVLASAVLAAPGGLEQMIAHYRQILKAAGPLWRWYWVWPQCFDVDVVITLEGEWLLHAEMFSGAAAAAAEWLRLAADAGRQPDAEDLEPRLELYDNQDQGWALRMVASEDEVFSLEWDPDDEDDLERVRMLRFPRQELAVKAAEACEQLTRVHTALVQAFGADLWNTPPGGRRKHTVPGWLIGLIVAVGVLRLLALLLR